MSHEDQIQQLLREKPGLKAQQIADELGLDRSNVVAALHGLGAGEVTQDNTYRWWPRTRESQGLDATPPRTLLANLCRYHLECLAHESASGVSIPAASAEYVPLDALPFAGMGAVPVEAERTAKKLIRKVRQERGQLTLYIGYGIRLRMVETPEAGEMRIEPVLLYPIDDTTEEYLRPATGIPLFNLDVLKTPFTVDSGNLIDEATHLADELGLANAEEELPPWDEVILRLARCRPEWDWREALNPYALSAGPPLSELRVPGIYNRAVLFAAPRSPYTYGLEIELRKLAQFDEDAVRNTALGLWLRGETIETRVPEDRPVLEVVPLNGEQRQAVVQSLSAPLTVVTGPPGTGKSQVVIALLANMAWQGSSVLCASKNNHAVDVVETRANGLGSHPVLLRLGKEEHQARLAEQLSASLAESASKDEQVRYAWLAKAHEQTREQFAAIEQKFHGVIALRNRVDELERASEPARAIFGAEGFTALHDFDVGAARHRLEALEASLETEKAAGVARLLQSRRWKRVSDALADLREDAARLGLNLPAEEASEDFAREMADRLTWAEHAADYWRGLEWLRAAPVLEELAGNLNRIAEESAGNSLELWRSWLRLWPSRWDPEQRKLLSEYVSLLQMIAGGDRFDEGVGRRVFRRYYSVFPKVTKLLPCWAVTSLSARGRLPFDPGFFDLVVIDEASQCDIASALPLLLRARRAVIIGDPMQLRHVSTVAPQQDRLLLAAHGLAEGCAAWAYSVNSLFDLARSLCRHEDIVNLRDHHRSHRDIIAFSNRHFYRGGLRVATDHDALNRPHTRGPAVRWIDVKGRVVRPARGGAMNPVEAEAVLAELRKLVLDEGYQGATGVVTPFRAQANRIRTLAHQDRDLSGRLTAVQFVVDTVHGFQGDERDVIFFSPVVSAGISESTLRFLKGHGNLFNVAITRARSELIVVGDREASLESEVGYLAGFAEYARDLEAQAPAPAGSPESGPEYPAVAHPELVSEWERVFYRALYAAGLRPVPQYEEAPYTLDFALFDGDRRLDIEIDGENYHRNWDGELCRRDQIRSRRLRDLGWDVLRLWVYEVRDDLEGSVGRVAGWMARAPSAR